MRKPLARHPSPPMDVAQMMQVLRSERERATAGTWRAACWLMFLAAVGPFLPFVGFRAAAAGVEIFAVLMLVLAAVLFIRGAVGRGVLTIIGTSILCLWLGGGALMGLIVAKKAWGFDIPKFIVLP